MKKLSAFAFTLTSLLALSNGLNASEKDANSKDPFTIKQFKLPTSLSSDLENYRHQWTRLTGFDFSGLHWNQFIVIYANKGSDIYKNNYRAYLDVYRSEEDEEDDIDLEDSPESFVTYDPGTIFVKENYLAAKGKPTKPLSLTIMIKHKPGFDPENGDWEYIQSDPDGKILLKGKVNDPAIHSVCGDCHQNMAERDYIFSTYYSEPSEAKED